MLVYFDLKIPSTAWSQPQTLLAELQALLPTPLPTDLSLQITPPRDVCVKWSEDIEPTIPNLAALRDRITKDFVRWQNIWQL